MKSSRIKLNLSVPEAATLGTTLDWIIAKLDPRMAKERAELNKLRNLLITKLSAAITDSEEAEWELKATMVGLVGRCVQILEDRDGP